MHALLCIRGNKVFELELVVFQHPACKAKSAPLNYAGRAEISDVYLNVITFSTTKKIAPVNYTRILLKVATVCHNNVDGYRFFVQSW